MRDTETRIILGFDERTIDWMYYNPDSTSGGQYVCGSMYFSDFRTSVEAEYDKNDGHLTEEGLKKLSEELEEMSDQFLIDVGHPDFERTEYYYETMKKEAIGYVGFTPTNIMLIYADILCDEISRLAERVKCSLTR